MSVPRLQVTKNYQLFTRCIDNRELNPRKHKRLSASMREYGFLPCFPLACVRDGAKHLVVFDGQHRLSEAETLGLPVYYVVVDIAFDIAKVNCAPEKWTTRNFAETFAAKGLKQYAFGLEFAEKYGIPVGCAFGLLGGTTTWSNIGAAYYSGRFKITDLEYAESVGDMYSQLVNLTKAIRSGRLLEACMAVARIPCFNTKRLIAGASKCRDKLVSYSTRDAYLGMLEEVYNHGHRKLLALRILATQAMRDRNAAKSNGHD